MAGFEEFTDPRLVAVYDLWDPVRTDTPFYVDLATELAASSVVDVGCGTGYLACELARHGHRVTGVDPSRPMLDVARRRPNGNLVRWIDGDASRLGDDEYDLAVMTGHVAQIIADDEDWRLTLAAIRRALRPGGRLAFESRDPAARGWEAWTPETSRRVLDGGELGTIEVWSQSTVVRGERVSSDLHYRFASSGEVLISHGEFRFRPRADLTRSLTEVGFSVQHVFGDHQRGPVKDGSPELVFVAARE